MQNDKNKSNSRSRRVPSVEETTAAITAEQEREEAVDSLSRNKSTTLKSQNQSSSFENMERSQDLSDDRSEDQDNQAAHSGQSETFVPLVLPDCKETDDHAQKMLDNLQRGRESRIQNYSMILDDLKELGMFGDLSEDHDYVTAHAVRRRTPSGNDNENDEGNSQ